MKRILTLISTLCIILSSSITCFAANGYEIIENSVYAKYNFGNDNISNATIENGNATIALPNNSTVQIIINNKYDGYVLVIRLMTQEDSEAYDWLKNCIPNDISSFQAYDIYLLTSNNDRIELPNDTLIKISCSERNRSVIGISYNSKIQNITTSYENGYFTFSSTEQANYYLVYNKTPDETDESPQTGDNSPMTLWLTLLFISGGALVGTATYTKKKRRFVK